MDDYFQRQMQLLTGRVTQNYLEGGVRISYSSPSEYNYVKTNDFSVDFIMTKAEEARVITHYQEALEMKHQFVLRLVDGNWLLDENSTVLRMRKLGISTHFDQDTFTSQLI